VLRGLRSASGDWIFQLDSDGQFLIEEFHHLWQLREDSDLLLGVRQSRHDPAHRILLSRIIAMAVSFLARRRLRDANSPFRLVRRELWDDLEPIIGASVRAPSIMVSLGAARRAWRLQPASRSLLRTTFGGIGSNQTRDQISGWSFLLPFVFSAAARRLQVACEGPR
jgi:hypothetical protein